MHILHSEYLKWHSFISWGSVSFKNNNLEFEYFVMISKIKVIKTKNAEAELEGIVYSGRTTNYTIYYRIQWYS